MLMELQRGISLERNSEKNGMVLEVIVDDFDGEKVTFGLVVKA